MNQDQKTGTLIIIVAVSLMGVALLVSDGWGGRIPLILFEFVWEKGGVYFVGKERELKVIDDVWVRIETRYVLAFLALVVGYGVARYLSLIPPVFKIALDMLRQRKPTP